ncbi:hypothetical protein FACS1894104_2010 [Actinomycetota bacterium]|nr:hypothetical protein FACS1894104_2010 [Actinomycetota bacterium]
MNSSNDRPIDELVYASGYERAYGVNPSRYQTLLVWQQQLARFYKTPTWSNDDELVATLDRIDKKLEYLNENRPLDESALASLQESFRVDFTHNSTAIEGNTLTLRETALVLTEGVTISEKPLKDHLEVIDNDKALEYILRAVERTATLDSELIKKIHAIVAHNDPAAIPVGEYATSLRTITGSNVVPPPPELIAQYLEDLISSMPEQPSITDTVRFHLVFEDIHPFNDGNGRTGRLLLNMMLIKQGYPPIVIKADPENRTAYYKAIDTFCDPEGDRDITPMLKVVANCVENSLDQYLCILPAKSLAEKVTEAEYQTDLNNSLSGKPNKNHDDLER